MFIEELTKKIINGGSISPQEALELFNCHLDSLSNAANTIRKHFCGNTFDICTIVNAKSGKCSEDCKYCAQSSHYNTKCESYPLLPMEKILNDAKYNANNGVLRYSLVTSGRALSNEEVDYICNVVKEINNNVNIRVCGSFGLLNAEQYKKLYSAGLKRIHNNLETSESNFSNMCSTHNFNDKVTAIKLAQSAGMNVCSGGIFGIGESNQDRVDLAFSIKELGIKSVPINLLNSIKGTPYENLKPLTSKELQYIVAVYRFILPDAFIRLAGGRGLLEDKGQGCFVSGANATISGDMLTTSGISIATDMQMIKELGFEVNLRDE